MKIANDVAKEAWVETTTGVDTIDWIGRPIHLDDVPAMLNPKTKQIRIFPSDVARAEIIGMARLHGLEPRDVALLLMVKAQPGIFRNKEEIQFKYHINKMLFYQWKEMEKQGIGETFPHDTFEKADRGPVPTNITDDLARLSNLGLISTELHRWGKRPRDESLHISLTAKGSALADELIRLVPEPLLQTTVEVKERIFPLDPESVKRRVHKEYPEYRNIYIEDDRD